MHRRIVLVFGLVMLFAAVGFAAQSACCFKVFTVCRCDDFVPGTESVTPSEALLDQIKNHYPIPGVKPCDKEQTNKYWGHTFTALKQPGCNIVGAFLCIKICNRNSTDHLKIGIITSGSDTWDWASGRFSERLTKLGLAVGQCGTITLDLTHLVRSAFPGQELNLLTAMNQHGWLDVVVDDDSTVDYAALFVVYDPCKCP